MKSRGALLPAAKNRLSYSAWMVLVLVFKRLSVEQNVPFLFLFFLFLMVLRSFLSLKKFVIWDVTRVTKVRQKLIT